jgi:uncharacterized membrane protein
MKQFFGAFFGSILGIIISTVLVVVVLIGIVKSSISKVDDKDETEVSIKNNSILKLTLDGPIVDRDLEDDPLKELKKNIATWRE